MDYNINYKDLLKLSKYKKKPIPLLNDLIKLSNNKRFLMIEIKPLLNEENLKILISGTCLALPIDANDAASGAACHLLAQSAPVRPEMSDKTQKWVTFQAFP